MPVSLLDVHEAQCEAELLVEEEEEKEEEEGEKQEKQEKQDQQQQQQRAVAELPLTPAFKCRVTPQSPTAKVTAKKNLKQEMRLLTDSIKGRVDLQSPAKRQRISQLKTYAQRMQEAIASGSTPGHSYTKHLNSLATDEEDTAEERFEEVFAALGLPVETSTSLFGN